jgi:hypothetical protein|nr:MAG TPA: hypothetical protein [Caudoviricetes sp.]DAV17266.1 MAG TPA: hypothetical protein [Caudoviricetes sp.]
MNTLAVSREFNVRPSQVLGLSTDIGCYCFDVACVYFLRQLDEDKKPRFEQDKKKNPGLQSLLMT